MKRKLVTTMIVILLLCVAFVFFAYRTNYIFYVDEDTSLQVATFNKRSVATIIEDITDQKGDYTDDSDDPDNSDLSINNPRALFVRYGGVDVGQAVEVNGLQLYDGLPWEAENCYVYTPAHGLKYVNKALTVDAVKAGVAYDDRDGMASNPAKDIDGIMCYHFATLPILANVKVGSGGSTTDLEHVVQDVRKVAAEVAYNGKVYYMPLTSKTVKAHAWPGGVYQTFLSNWSARDGKNHQQTYNHWFFNNDGGPIQGDIISSASNLIELTNLADIRSGYTSVTYSGGTVAPSFSLEVTSSVANKLKDMDFRSFIIWDYRPVSEKEKGGYDKDWLQHVKRCHNIWGMSGLFYRMNGGQEHKDENTYSYTMYNERVKQDCSGFVCYCLATYGKSDLIYARGVNYNRYLEEIKENGSQSDWSSVDSRFEAVPKPWNEETVKAGDICVYPGHVQVYVSPNTTVSWGGHSSTEDLYKGHVGDDPFKVYVDCVTQNGSHCNFGTLRGVYRLK